MTKKTSRMGSTAKAAPVCWRLEAIQMQRKGCSTKWRKEIWPKFLQNLDCPERKWFWYWNQLPGLKVLRSTFHLYQIARLFWPLRSLLSLLSTLPQIFYLLTSKGTWPSLGTPFYRSHRLRLIRRKTVSMSWEFGWSWKIIEKSTSFSPKIQVNLYKNFIRDRSL